MRIDSSGRVIIAGTSGTGRLNIKGNGGDGIKIENAGGTNSACIDLKSTLTNYEKEYRLAVAGSDGIYATAKALFVRDQTAGVNRFEIQDGGDVRVSTGNLIIGTSGKGIDFSATSDASGKTSELLEDYEEGTWSPAVQQGVTNTQTFDSKGRYTKIGRQVYCQFLLQFSGAGTGARVQFSGLPFTSANNSSRGGGTVLWTNIPGLNDFDFISVIVAGNATNIECYQNMDSNATTGSGGFTNKAFYARFTYEAA